MIEPPPRLPATVRAALWRMERRYPEASRETLSTVDKLVQLGWGQRLNPTSRYVSITRTGREFIRDYLNNPNAPAIRC